MKKRTETKPVKGGWVRREEATGRLVEVGRDDQYTSRSTFKTGATLKDAAARRRSALKRLADR